MFPPASTFPAYGTTSDALGRWEYANPVAAMVHNERDQKLKGRKAILQETAIAQNCSVQE